jgi:protein-S-isoprenylcysteine O-methyltransferase Ste14
MNKTFLFIQKQLDGLIYFFIGPFAVLFIFPEFFLALENKLNLQLERYVFLNYTGTLLMWAGALLAVWCSILMYMNKKGSPNPFALPQKIVTKGPYSLVRHPMMWSIHLVLIGEIFAQSSPMLVVWLIIWLRFSVLYIANYEEPFLNSVFGEEYKTYCAKTPRWIPLYKTSQVDSNN